MFITFNTIKQAKQYMKLRYKDKYAETVRYTLGDHPIYSLYIDKKNKIVEATGWLCGCGCGKGSVTAIVIGKIKNGVKA